MGSGTWKIWQKCFFFQKVAPIFNHWSNNIWKSPYVLCRNFLKASLRKQKVWVFVFLCIRNVKKIGGYFLKKKTHFCQIFSISDPVPYSKPYGPQYTTPYAMFRKKLELAVACLWWLILINHWFLGLYQGAIKTGLPRAFQNGMAIGITPKNEVLRGKSLK